ncbi:MAG: hypothetical protein LBQ41_00790 [Candidatus Ancillula sp.]|jgi:hypothetical protein|nr:hypothetical protein [Candidatus Ancillula sp.]
MKVIELPVMLDSEQQLWETLFDVSKIYPDNWTLVGGQMVYLHCVERGGQMIRVTNDLDALLNVRAKSDALYDFTKRLTDIGFDSVGVSPEGYEHRWIKDKVQIDILIPDHLGEQAQSKLSVHGFKTIATPGAQQALDRTEKIRFYRMGFRE